jgi:hypothetical protein
MEQYFRVARLHRGEPDGAICVDCATYIMPSAESEEVGDAISWCDRSAQHFATKGDIVVTEKFLRVARLLRSLRQPREVEPGP